LLQQPSSSLPAKLKTIRGARFTAAGWAAAAQIAASQHFNSAWTPPAGLAASVNRTRNTSHHPDHTRTKGAIRLWNARGELPRTIDELATRQKEIQYSSRTRASTDSFESIQRLRRALANLFEKLPETLRNGPEAQLLQPLGNNRVYNIVHLIYRALRTTKAIRRITTSRAPACTSIGAPAITTPFARCVLRDAHL
jgi:hypothetical protein